MRKVDPCEWGMLMMQRSVDLNKAVAAFGGYSAMARALDWPLSTVHGWARWDKLPHWRAEKIAAVAKAEKLDVFKAKRGARRKKARG